MKENVLENTRRNASWKRSASSITEIVRGLTPPTESGSKGFQEETNDCYISLSYVLAITSFIRSNDQAAETGDCIQFVDHYKWQCPSEVW